MPGPASRARATAALVVLCALGASSLSSCSSDDAEASDATSTHQHPTGTSKPSGQARVANVVVTAADGCTTDRDSFPAGGVTFKVQNKDAAAVSEVELISGQRIIGERENLPPGLSGSFSVHVLAGTYTLYCPGAATEKTTITVTGKAPSNGDASTAQLLEAGTKQWGRYVTTQVHYLVHSVADLSQALHGTNLAAAQAAYMKARPYYEKIEPVAESFTVGKTSLDSDIDARLNDVPASQWQGFHRIEKGLFEDKSLDGLGDYGATLLANVKKLRSLTKDLTYQPYELANGAQELLSEVASSKITGEEERYSLIDLLDFQANDEGAEQAFADLEPALATIDPELTRQVSGAFDALDALVDSYRTNANPSGFVLYDALTTSDKKQLAAAVLNVQEPLSQVAAKVAHL
jgi:iron uptake system component EfeO